MLKLQKSSRFEFLAISLRQQTPFWTSTLFQALGIAFSIHAAIFLLVHIAPFSFEPTFIFAPIQVESTLFASTAEVAIEEEAAFTPPFSVLSSFDLLYQIPQLPLSPSCCWEEEALVAMESRSWPRHTDLIAPQACRLKISTSGDLSRYRMREPLLEAKNTPLASHDHFASYRVKVDGKEGKIFWYTLLESNGGQKINESFQNILVDLSFAIEDSAEESVIEGIVDLSFFCR